jgi:Uma2 family endonuclease
MAAVPVQEAFAEPNVPPEAPPLHMSYEAFLDWLDEGKHAEWVNGEIVLHSPVSRGHNRRNAQREWEAAV